MLEQMLDHFSAALKALAGSAQPVGLAWAQEPRSRLLGCAVASCEWKLRAQEFAEGSAPWLSNSSSAPGCALDLCIGIARDEHGGVKRAACASIPLSAMSLVRGSTEMEALFSVYY